MICTASCPLLDALTGPAARDTFMVRPQEEGCSGDKEISATVDLAFCVTIVVPTVRQRLLTLSLPIS